MKMVRIEFIKKSGPEPDPIGVGWRPLSILILNVINALRFR